MDKSEFEALVEAHLKSVYSFALRFVGEREEAEDIAQETFVKAWQKLATYVPEKSSFKTWVLRIARNSAIDFLRKRKNIPFSHFEVEGQNVLHETLQDTATLPEELFAKGEDAQEVSRALATLRPPAREVLLLYYTNELTFEEIGTLLEESPNTVKSRHRRALASLRKVMHPHAPK